jgi:hypothetical protein
MNNVRSILEDAYQLAASSDNTHPELSATQENWIKIISEKAESQKAVRSINSANSHTARLRSDC